MYKHKTEQEIKLQNRVDNAKLDDTDYRALYWQLWGACSTNNGKAWKTFEHITTSYLGFKEKNAKTTKD